MTRPNLTQALVLGFSVLFLASCSTTESRISEKPQIYQSLSAQDQQMVAQGQIRTGMSRDAVWLAWGAPSEKSEGAMRGKATETWVYVQMRTAPYGSAYYPYYGHGLRPYGYGHGVYRWHGHRRFHFYGDPFYDPFYYSHIPPTVSFPYKIVTFSNGRVMSFQYLVR